MDEASTQQFRAPEDPEILNATTESSRDLASVRDRTLILKGILRRTRTLLGADMAYLSLNDLPSGETYIHVTDNVRTEAYRNIRMPLGTGVLGAVAAGGSTASTLDYLADPNMNHIPTIDQVVAVEGVKAIAGAPLRVGGRIVGALLVAHRSPASLPAAGERALEHMAAQAAIALEQTRRGSEIMQLRALIGSTTTSNAGRTRELEAMLALDERLMGSMVASVNAEGVVAVLEEATGRPLGLFDPTGRHRFGSVTLNKPSLENWGVQSAINTSLHGAGAATVRYKGEVYTVVAVAAGKEHLATLVMNGTAGKEIALLERGSVFVSAALLFERTLVDANNRAQSTLMEDLLASRTEDQAQAVRAKFVAFGIELRGETAVLVILIDPPVRHNALATVQQRLRKGAMLVSAHMGHICVVTTSAGATLAKEMDQILHQEGISAVIGHATSSSGSINGIRGAHDEASEVVMAAKELGWRRGFADLNDLGIAGIMLSHDSASTAARIVERTVGPVQEYDRAHRTDLLGTLWAYLESGSSLQTTASQLHIHQNTVRQRLERIDSLLGAQWRTPSRRIDVHFALRLWKLVPPTSKPDAVRGQ
ncbi:hypothetical protein CQ020_14005 [Arthrobacter sp. MYb23]|uniref:helix-turn-helix domain-containing protein n=1 Tax=unclassified Arthrobacter TaxID=235627 RepID=UPI000CFE322A|nr:MULTISPECIES: helix-turn-helix domain-containing protein [unclassified Arthrobacter]PRB41019.1 hypothetical protein CQ038_14520 [Arthrobacter sp. MYb51]PRB94689.1 hypothetical protein CQ020_14005 [Arthrobacter sp. MYb23]